MAQADNFTKYAAGGSGDNIVANGYIKQKESIWVDSYTIAFTNTNTTIDIAVVPEGAIITSIQALIATSISQTSGTISIGYSSDTAIDSFLAPTTISHNLTRTGVSLPAQGIIQNYTSATTTNTTQVLQAVAVLAGFQATPTNSAATISIKLNNWTMTTGTVKTLVRYVGR